MQIKSRWIISEFMLEDEIDSVAKAKGVALRPRIELSLSKIDTEVTRLISLSQELKLMCNRDKNTMISYSLDESCLQDKTRGCSNLFQVKRMLKVVMMSITSLDTLAVRLHSASDFGEVVKVLCPAIVVIKNVRSALMRYVSGSHVEIADICACLEVILVDACQLTDCIINFNEAKQQAVSLLNNAYLTAETKMNEEFPDSSE
jgi:hypothetical protein